MASENELLQKIASIEKQLYDLSETIQHTNAKVNWQYVAGKAEAMKNVAKHVRDQVKHKTN